MGLVIGFGALEARQERVVDIDAAAFQLGRQAVGQHLHVAGEHHQVGPGLADQPPESRLLLELGLARHRQVVERQVRQVEVPIDLRRVVGDDGGDIHRQLADPPAIEQVGQAVVGLAGQDHHPLAHRRVAQAPAHGELLGQRGERLAQVIGGQVVGPEHHPHEEDVRLGVVELLRVEDVAAGLGQEGRNRRDDAATIGAGDGEDQALGRHGRGA